MLHTTVVQGSSISGESEIFKAKQAVCERGNKLNEVEEKTELLSNDAKVIQFGQSKAMNRLCVPFN